SDKYSDDGEFPKEDSRHIDKQSEDKIEKIRLEQEENEMIDRIISGSFFYEDAPNKSIYGLKQLLPEKRMIYVSKRRLFFALHTLFPFITSCLSSLYDKTNNLIEPQTRTDICIHCHQADNIFLQMQRQKLKFEQLLNSQQQILIFWILHISRANNQRDQLEMQIQCPSFGQYTLQIDYKENFSLCKLAIFFKIDENNESIQKAITILSPIISHTGSIILLSLARIFKSEFFNVVKTGFWYSDGGPHFRNQQVVCMLLRKDVPLFKNVEFQVSFCEPFHEKERDDQLFGAYVPAPK
ncbi:MAG: hypothetical protein EZS28_011339, partial [Streblomastix strix]